MSQEEYIEQDFSENDMYFTTKIHKNCRKFYKRIYDLKIDIKESFVNDLSFLGTLSIQRFSETIPSAKDVFTTKGKDKLEVSGVIDSKQILLVIPKNEEQLFIDFEEKLKNYCSKNS